MADYPSTIYNPTPKTNKVDLVDAAHINKVDTETRATQLELGPNVAGDCVDLVTRLAVSLHGDGALNHGDEFPDDPINCQPFVRDDEGNAFYLFNEGLDAWQGISTLSNLIYCWTGKDNGASNNTIFHGTGVSHNAGGEANNLYHAVFSQNTYETIITAKFRKIAGVNTITVWARIWSDSGAGDATVKVDVGGQNNSGARNSTSPGEITPFTIDVSSLTNGTLYDITIQLKNTDAATNHSTYLSAIALLGS